MNKTVYCDTVKASMFEAGAGKAFDENYDHCSWQTEGEGQFRALDGSDPFIGKINDDQKVKELKVEMICSKNNLDQAITALKQAHPYEVPAYYITEAII